VGWILGQFNPCGVAVIQNLPEALSLVLHYFEIKFL
jgi:hypothetical protein